MVRRLTALVLLFVVFNTGVLGAQAATGGITPGQQTSETPYIDLDSDTVPDQINWDTTFGTAVQVSDTDLSGEIWSEGMGWIKLDPLGGGVTNDGAGTLSGYAWGHNAGWISFDCNNGSNCGSNGNFGVDIDPTTGNFSGDAWSENFGWIHFACPGASTCVNTDWRPDTVTPGGGGSGGHPECSDGVDNDGDGSTDYPSDSGCTSPTDNSEGAAITGYACSDGLDNDGDGYTDYPSDPGCVTSSDTSEFNQFDIYPEPPTLEEVTDEPTDVDLEAFTTDEGYPFDPVLDTTISFTDPNGTPLTRDLDSAYYLPATYETVFTLTTKEPATRVWSYVIYIGDVPDSREIINESHNIIERLFRMFFVQFAQAEGLSDRYEYEKMSPTQFKLKYTTPDKPGIYEFYTVVEYASSQTEVIRTDMVIVEFNGDTFKSNLIFGNWSPLSANVSLWSRNATTGEFEIAKIEEGKANPMISNEKGLYSFVVPQGDYLIRADKNGYYDFESKVFPAERNGDIVNYRVELVCSFFGNLWCGWEVKLAIILLIIYIATRKKKRRRKTTPFVKGTEGSHVSTDNPVL